MNRSKEHVIPKSIGGRKTIEDFICTNCNNTAGTECDNELYEQLKPFCTMLGIKRSGKDNQPVEIRGADGKEFILNPDASIAIPYLIRNERAVGDKIEVIIQTKSMKEAKRQLTQEAAKRPHLDVEKIISNASSLRDQIQAPLRMSLPLFLSGAGAGRSIVKSCLALAYEAGVSIDDCEVARRYLEGKADACFGYYNESDLVKNRPSGNYFHCIYVIGDPACNHIIAYVEYFGYLRLVVRLSDNYRGNSFDICYAIDPVSGEELDLDVALEFSQKDIPAILAGEKLDEEKAKSFLKSLVTTCLWHLMVTHAFESANEVCGVDSKQELSGELLDKWINSFAGSFTRTLLSASPHHALSAGDVKASGGESTS